MKDEHHMHDSAASPQPTHSHSMQCMEIWGGNHPTQRSVSTPGLDIWVWSQPYQASAGGGDVHYVSLCGGGETTRLILADIAGHGASVADTAVDLRRLMRESINHKSQSRLVQRLNRQFAKLSKLKKFATAVVATYLARTNQLTLSNAGHPRPLFYQASNATWSFINDNRGDGTQGLANLPLGVDGTTNYPPVILNLQPGDLLLIYTDALPESKGTGGMLGEQGLLEVLQTLDATHPATLVQQLITRLHDHLNSQPAIDDATILLLHHNGTRPSPLSLTQKLDVYAKVFRLKRV
jgi:phosphoserine phosphatase RsbU/P